jgi:hypothetical protein
VAGAATLLTANAAIIFTDNVNATVDLTPPSNQSIPIQLDGPTGTGFVFFSQFDSKGGAQTSGTISINFFKPVVDGPDANLVKLGSGVTIDSSSNFTTGFGTQATGPTGQWTPGDDAYFGFELQPSGSPMLYGWGRLVRSASGTDTLTLTQWAYDNTGASIATGQTSAVPEPGACAVVAGAGLMALAGGRRLIRSRP